MSTAIAASPTVPQAAVAPAPSSSLNSQPLPRLAYPLLDLHQGIKTLMNSISNPPHQTLGSQRPARPAPFCAAAAASSPEPALPSGATGAESSSALPGADAVGDAGDSAWSGPRFRSVSQRVKSGSGDAGFFDPRGARRSHLGPLRGRHRRGGRRRGRALPGGRGGGAPASLHHGVRRRRGFPPLPLVSPSFPPLSSERNSFGFPGIFFPPLEMVLLTFFLCQREEGR